MVVGDNVKLNAGGPTMTIMHIAVGKATCSYWDINNNLHVDTFPLEAIHLV